MKKYIFVRSLTLGFMLGLVWSIQLQVTIDYSYNFFLTKRIRNLIFKTHFIYNR